MKTLKTKPVSPAAAQLRAARQKQGAYHVSFRVRPGGVVHKALVFASSTHAAEQQITQQFRWEFDGLKIVAVSEVDGQAGLELEGRPVR